MAPKKLLLAPMVAGICFISCTNADKKQSEALPQDATAIAKTADVKSYVSLFEIPANDISRAINFYQAILDIKIEKFEMAGMQMGVFPYEGQIVSAVILKAEGYKPSADGVTNYLNAGDNLQVILDKMEKNGGKILTPKTPHADGNGFFAIFLDSEGNRMGLNSQY